MEDVKGFCDFLYETDQLVQSHIESMEGTLSKGQCAALTLEQFHQPVLFDAMVGELKRCVSTSSDSYILGLKPLC